MIEALKNENNTPKSLHVDNVIYGTNCNTYKVATDIKNNNENIQQAIEKMGEFYFIPNPGNLGDVVIAQAEYEYLNALKSTYKIVDFDRSLLPDKEDFNLVYGGGGLFVKYWGYDNFLKVFQMPNLKSCVILPSSFYECSDLMDVLDERFTVFCREEKSYKYCLEHNKKARFIMADDMALSLETNFDCAKQNNFEQNVDNLKKTPALLSELNKIYEKYKEVEHNISAAIKKKTVVNAFNQRIGYMFRNDAESNYDAKSIQANNIDLSLFSTSSCTSQGAVKVLSELFIKAINSFDIIFTDRLHIGLVATLLGKRVFVVDNSYGKVSGVYDYSLKNFKNIRLIKSINDVQLSSEEIVNKADLSLLNNPISYSDFVSKYLITDNTDSGFINIISKWGQINE